MYFSARPKKGLHVQGRDCINTSGNIPRDAASSLTSLQACRLLTTRPPSSGVIELRRHEHQSLPRKHVNVEPGTSFVSSREPHQLVHSPVKLYAQVLRAGICLSTRHIPGHGLDSHIDERKAFQMCTNMCAGFAYVQSSLVRSRSVGGSGANLALLRWNLHKKDHPEHKCLSNRSVCSWYWVYPPWHLEGLAN